LRFKELPGPIIFTLIVLAADFDMDVKEKLEATKRLAEREVGDDAGTVIRTINESCESVRRERTYEEINSDQHHE
jgi:hypothetical protein